MKLRPRVALLSAALCGLTLGAAAPAQARPPQARPPQYLTQDPTQLAVAQADAALEANSGAIHGAPGDRYRLWRVILDPDGAAHVRYTREYRDLPVVGGDLVVHLDREGRFVRASTSLDEPIAIEVEPRIGAAQAAGAILTQPDAVLTEPPRLVVDAADGTAALAWQAHAIVGGAGLTAFVDANDGQLSRTESDYQESGTGNSMYGGTVALDTTFGSGTYSLVDPVRGNATTCDLGHAWSGPCPTFTDADNVWGNGSPTHNQTAAVDAHYGSANAFDYYKNVLGRNGVFGDGTGVVSHVHTGNNWVNAHWDGFAKLVEYGDGASNEHPLTSLDVTAHEMTHGVTQFTANLSYSKEAGGLNEATSDIFGTMAEFYAANSSDPGDYLIGEKVDIYGTGDPLRYMFHPSLDGSSADCWYPSVGDIDVHWSSGVGNHFFFLLAEGSGVTSYGTSPTCDGGSVLGIGRTKAAKIWFHALDAYFTSGETYSDAAADTLAAAADLYGMCSSEWFSVHAAWSAVNVAGFALPCFLPKYYKWVCICIWPCPDPGPVHWVVELPDWGQLDEIEIGVDIIHGRRGDLQIDLMSPTGQTYRLKNADPADVGQDVIDVFHLQLGPGQVMPGSWALVVTDIVPGVQGQIHGWSMLI